MVEVGVKKCLENLVTVIYGQYQWQSKSHGHACRLEKMFPGKYGHSERSTGADFRDLFEVPFGFENLWHQTHLQLWLVQLYFNVNKSGKSIMFYVIPN